MAFAVGAIVAVGTEVGFSVGAGVGTGAVVALGVGTGAMFAMGVDVAGVTVAVGVGVAEVTVGTDWPPQATSKAAPSDTAASVLVTLNIGRIIANFDEWFTEQ